MALVDDCTYIVVTPDGDIFPETFSREYLEDFLPGGPRGGLPAGLGAARGQPVYRFDQRPVGVELRDLIEEGRVKAAEERRALGLPSEDPEPQPLLGDAAADPVTSLTPPPLLPSLLMFGRKALSATLRSWWTYWRRRARRVSAAIVLGHAMRGTENLRPTGGLESSTWAKRARKQLFMHKRS